MFLESMIEHLFNFWVDVILRLFPILNHMDMNWLVVIGVELKNITEEYEYGWNTLILLFFCKDIQKLSNKCFLSRKTAFFFASLQKVYENHTQNCMIFLHFVFSVCFSYTFIIYNA